MRNPHQVGEGCVFRQDMLTLRELLPALQLIILVDAVADRLTNLDREE